MHEASSRAEVTRERTSVRRIINQMLQDGRGYSQSLSDATKDVNLSSSNA